MEEIERTGNDILNSEFSWNDKTPPILRKLEDIQTWCLFDGEQKWNWDETQCESESHAASILLTYNAPDLL